MTERLTDGAGPFPRFAEGLSVVLTVLAFAAVGLWGSPADAHDCCTRATVTDCAPASGPAVDCMEGAAASSVCCCKADGTPRSAVSRARSFVSFDSLLAGLSPLRPAYSRLSFTAEFERPQATKQPASRRTGVPLFLEHAVLRL